MLGLEINYFSILAATVASFLLGWLWYGPLFGKQWMNLMGFKKRNMKSMKMSAGTAMILGFLSYLLIAYVLSLFINYFNAYTIIKGLQLGFWIWLGFIATTTMGSVLWENKSPKLYFLNNAYNLLSLEMMAVILSIWH